MSQMLTSNAVPQAGSGETASRQLTFARALLGFPDSHRFLLCSLGERYAPFLSLTSIDQPGLDFIVVAPGALFSDYVFAIGEDDASLVEAATSDDIEVLVLVSRRKGASPTVNLMGPLVVNRRTDTATQIVLQDAGYAVAVPVDATSARSAS